MISSLRPFEHFQNWFWAVQNHRFYTKIMRFNEEPNPNQINNRPNPVTNIVRLPPNVVEITLSSRYHQIDKDTIVAIL